MSRDILDEARSQVLHEGRGLDQGQVAGADLDMLARLKMPIKALSATL